MNPTTNAFYLLKKNRLRKSSMFHIMFIWYHLNQTPVQLKPWLSVTRLRSGPQPEMGWGPRARARAGHVQTSSTTHHNSNQLHPKDTGYAIKVALYKFWNHTFSIMKGRGLYLKLHIAELTVNQLFHYTQHKKKKKHFSIWRNRKEI